MANMNPDISGLIPYEKGKSGNPGGKSKEQKGKEVANAEKAVSIREKILAQLEAQIDGIIEKGGDGLDDILAHLNPNTLRMLKDSEDRGLGAPVQPVTSSDEAMRPTIIELVAPTQEAVLAAINRKFK